MEESHFNKETLARIDQSIANGIRSVSFGDKTITFHSLDEMLKLRNQVARFLYGRESKRHFFPAVNKGL